MNLNVKFLRSELEKTINPIKTYRGTLLSEEDIKELRIEAKKIKDAYRKSARRARHTYVK